MSLKQFFALLGFAFVVVWAAIGLGTAILCLLGAGVFAALGAVVSGQIDLAAVQERVRQGREEVASVVAPAPGPPSPTYAPPPPPAPVRARRVR